ncbi:MAG TPA: transposase [Planctomycetes bacterium]|nr:transposase [Planctomycetota bacterium]
MLREMRALARQRPRFGAERIHDLLVNRHWRVNHKRVHRLWRRENMQVPRKQQQGHPERCHFPYSVACFLSVSGTSRPPWLQVPSAVSPALLRVPRYCSLIAATSNLSLSPSTDQVALKPVRPSVTLSK